MIRLIIFLEFLAVALGGLIPCEPTIEEYIVGGNATKIKEVPYQVSLFQRSRFICGGSIISKTHILTAAHCVSDAYAEGSIFNIRAGSDREIHGGVYIAAKKFVFHPKFTMQTLDYDVAIIELSKPLEFNASVKAIKLADKVPADGEMVKASGWGCLKENGLRPVQLQSVLVPMVNRKTCEKNYERFMKITPRMICAGVEGKDACQGDSGGPLAYKDTVVGIVSTGVGCGRKNFPGIYTNVADPDVRKFIKEHSGV